MQRSHRDAQQKFPQALSGWLVGCCLAWLLGGCVSFAPQPPAAPPLSPAALGVPERFRHGPPAASAPAAPSEPQAMPGSVLPRWWAPLADPTLEALQAQLLSRNWSLQAAAAAVDAAQAALGGAQASRQPSVGLSASASRSQAPVGAPGTALVAQASLASWELDLWGRLRAQQDAASARLDASRASLAAARLSLQAQLVQTYLSWRANQALQSLLRQSAESFAQTLQLVQHRHQAGLATVADLAQARSQWLGVRAQLQDAQLQGQQLLHALALLVGQPPAAFELPGSPEPQAAVAAGDGSAARGATRPTLASWVDPLPPAVSVPPLLPSDLLRRRPDLAAAMAQVEAAQAQLGVAQAAFFPSLTLSAAAGVRGSGWARLIDAPQSLWSLGAAAALSLWDGGAREAAQDAAQAALQQAAIQYRQAVLSALQEVEDNLAAAVQLQEAVALQRQALVAAEEALAVLLHQYHAGTVAYLNVLTAQNTVLAARRSLLDARTRQLLALNQLLKNAGGAW